MLYTVVSFLSPFISILLMPSSTNWLIPFSLFVIKPKAIQKYMHFRG